MTNQTLVSPQTLERLLERGSSVSTTFTLIPPSVQRNAEQELMAKSAIVVPEELATLKNRVLIFVNSGLQTLGETDDRSARTIFHNPRLVAVKDFSTINSQAEAYPSLSQKQIREIEFEQLVVKSHKLDVQLGDRLDLFAVVPVDTKVTNDPSETFIYLKRVQFAKVSRFIATASAMTVATIINEGGNLAHSKWIAVAAIEKMVKDVKLGIASAFCKTLEYNKFHTKDGDIDFHLILRRKTSRNQILKAASLLYDQVTECQTVDEIVDAFYAFNPLASRTDYQNRMIETAIASPQNLLDRQM